MQQPKAGTTKAYAVLIKYGLWSVDCHYIQPQCKHKEQSKANSNNRTNNFKYFYFGHIHKHGTGERERGCPAYVHQVNAVQLQVAPFLCSSLDIEEYLVSSYFCLSFYIVSATCFSDRCTNMPHASSIQLYLWRKYHSKKLIINLLLQWSKSLKKICVQRCMQFGSILSFFNRTCQFP